MPAAADDLFTVPLSQLPYDPHDPDSVVAHARRLKGRTVWDVAEELDFQPVLSSKNQGKGKAGDLVEAWFHLVPNTRSEADLPCGVEIKSAPLKRKADDGLSSKERMVLGMIPYHDIVNEEWPRAKIRKKIERILFVVRLHDQDEHGRSRFVDAFLWTPPPDDVPQLAIDWTATREMVRAGRAHELTESLGRIMGPCTKGQGTKKDPEADYTTQPCSKVKAKKRAFAFKGGYVWVQVKKELEPQRLVRASDLLAREVPVLTLDDIGILNETGRTRIHIIESAVLARLHGHEGRTIGDVCTSLGIPVKTSGNDKSLAARLLNAILKADKKATIEELAAEGVIVKSVHAREPGSGRTTKAEDKYPFEAMSFPAIDFDEFLEEDWDAGTARVIDHVERILMVPTYSGARNTRQELRKIGRAFFWSPTASQMDQIEVDWKEIQEIVKKGGAAERPVLGADGTQKMKKTTKRLIPETTNDLPGERQGHILHMRPHTDDADDKVAVPGGVITRQSFWLNKHFVHELLVAADGPEAARAGITLT